MAQYMNGYTEKEVDNLSSANHTWISGRSGILTNGFICPSSVFIAVRICVGIAFFFHRFATICTFWVNPNIILRISLSDSGITTLHCFCWCFQVGAIYQHRLFLLNLSLWQDIVCKAIFHQVNFGWNISPVFPHILKYWSLLRFQIKGQIDTPVYYAINSLIPKKCSLFVRCLNWLCFSFFRFLCRLKLSRLMNRKGSTSRDLSNGDRS